MATAPHTQTEDEREESHMTQNKSMAPCRLGSEVQLLVMDAVCTIMSLIVNPILLPWLGYTSGDINLIVVTGLLLNIPMLWRFAVQFCYRRTPLAVARMSCWIRFQCHVGFMMYPPPLEDTEPALAVPRQRARNFLSRVRVYSLVQLTSDERKIRPVFHVR